jgi:hypothetical protein
MNVQRFLKRTVTVAQRHQALRLPAAFTTRMPADSDGHPRSGPCVKGETRKESFPGGEREKGASPLRRHFDDAQSFNVSKPPMTRRQKKIYCCSFPSSIIRVVARPLRTHLRLRTRAFLRPPALAPSPLAPSRPARSRAAAPSCPRARAPPSPPPPSAFAT